MTRDDMYDVLYDGTPEEIAGLRCPDCGGELEWSFGFDNSGKAYMTVKCPCKTDSLYGGTETPNCAEFFGNTPGTKSASPLAVSVAV